MAVATQPVSERFTPYKEQEPFLWNRHRYYGFISGVGAGKTATGVFRTALNAELWNCGEMGAIVAPSTRMIKNAIFPVMAEFGLRDRWEFTGFQAEEPGFHTPDDGRILILSADNERTVERLANLNLAYWWLDEAKETPKRARDVLRERLRKGHYRNGYITTTPKGHDHNYDFFVGDPKADDQLTKRGWGDYDSTTIYEGYDDRLCVAHVPSWANPHNPEDFKDEMRNLPEQLRRQQAEGYFVEFGGGLLDRDSLTFVDADSLKTDREFKWVVTADLALEADPGRARDNDTDYWAAAILAVDQFSSTAYLVDVARTRGMTKDQGVGWLRGIMDGVPTNKVGIEANQAQRWFVQDAQNAGLRAYPIENRRNKEERLTYLSVPFANGSVKVVNHDGEEPYDDRWQPFVDEWVGFPNAAHDDILDAVEMAVRQVSLGQGIGAMEAGSAYGEN